MSLIHFHRFLITCGILFCLGYAGWEVRSFLERGSLGALLLVVAFVGLALLLGVYLWQLNRWLGYGEEPGDEGSPYGR
ncbi:MAG: hypothetical protein GWO17_23545 [Gemmatimonadetes bacterium]|nr:hypothetical protein [Gemmatimonadota bacterium]